MFSSLGRAQKFHRVSPIIRSALQQRRQVSQYNHHVAGLTSDQVEVSYGAKSLFLNIYSFCKLLIMKKGNLHYPLSNIKFRDAITQFVESEVAHRADEVDRTNTFPIVGVYERLCF